MASGLSDRIARKVIGYVRGDTTMGQLRDYLAPIVWDIESSCDPAAEALAYGVELFLAEYDHGHRSERELKEKLLSLIPRSAATTESVTTHLNASMMYLRPPSGMLLPTAS